MATVVQLGAVSLDCDDVTELIGFYSRLLDTPVYFETEEFGCLKAVALWLTVHHVDAYVRPTWPDATTPKQFHLDFSTTDLDASELFALECGAQKADHQPSPDGSWKVFLDPAGHPFCLTTNVPDPLTA